MSLSRNLELLSAAEGYSIRKVAAAMPTYRVERRDDGRYVAECIEGRWSYYITGMYDNGSDWEQLDLDALAKLAAFCEMLTGE